MIIIASNIILFLIILSFQCRLLKIKSFIVCKKKIPLILLIWCFFPRDISIEIICVLFFIIISIFKQSPPRHSPIGQSSVEHSSAGHSLKRTLWQMDTSVVAQPYVRHSGSRTLPQQYTISYRRVQIRTLQSMLDFPVSEVQLSDYKWLKSTFLKK